MAYKNPYASGSGYKNPYTSSGRKQSQFYVPKTMEEWEQMAEVFGLKKEPSFLKKVGTALGKGVSTVFDVMSIPLYGIAGGAKALVKNFDDVVENDENVLKEMWKGVTLKEKDTYIDVLESAGVQNKWSKNIIGTALNIVGDPITYMTGGGILKIIGKNGKHLTKEGLSIFKSVTKQMNKVDDVIRGFDKLNDSQKISKHLIRKDRLYKEMLDIFSKDPDKYFRGIEMFGKEVLPRKLVSGGITKDILTKTKIGTKLWDKIDNVNSTAKGVIDAMFTKGKNVSAGIDFPINKALGAKRRAVSDVQDMVENAEKVLKGKYGKERAEEAIKGGVKKLQAIKKDYAKIFKGKIDDTLKQLKAAKISVPKSIEGYETLAPKDIKKLVTSIKKKVKDPTEQKRLLNLVDGLSSARKEAIEQINKAGIGAISEPSKEYLDLMKPVMDKVKGLAGLDDGLNYYMPSLSKEYIMNNVKEVVGNNVAVKTIKEFGDKIGEKNLINNPVIAWTTKTAQLARNKINSDVMEYLVGVYGYTPKAFKDLANKEGFSAIKTGKKLVGYLKKEDFNFVNNALNPEYKTLDMISRAVGYDQFTSLFKRAVTAYFPAFHIRNYISGIVQNYQVLGKEAFNYTNNFRDNFRVWKALKSGTDEVVTWGGKKRTLKELSENFFDRFFQSSRYSFDNQAMDKFVDGFMGMKKKVAGMEKLGNSIEVNQKLVAYVTALKQGNGIDDALKLAEKAGFDYRNISKFESQIMKRLFPFYTFARKNAELQTRTLISTPARIANQKKMLDAFSGIFGGSQLSNEDLEALPDWVKDALKIKIGNDKVLSGLDFPVQEFFSRTSDPITTSIVSMNPLIKYVAEAETGYDFFRGKQIKDIKYIQKPLHDILTNDKTPKFIKDLFSATSYETTQKVGKDKGKKITIYEADPKNLHKLRSLPTSRLQNTIELLLGEGTTAEKMTAFFLGAKIYDIDSELQKYYNSRSLQEEYREELMRIGGSYEFQQFLIPKSEIIEAQQNKE